MREGRLLILALAAALAAEAAVRETEVDALALAAWSEDHLAGAAVMWTAVNRARERGTSPWVEVHRPGQYRGIERGDPRRWRTGPRDLAVLDGLRRLADRVLRGEVRDPGGGATHFHRAGTPAPPWAPPPRRWTAAGRHVFYRPAGTENSPRKQRTYGRRGVAERRRSPYYPFMKRTMTRRTEAALAALAAAGDHNSKVLLALARKGGIPQGATRLVVSK